MIESQPSPRHRTRRVILAALLTAGSGYVAAKAVSGHDSGSAVGIGASHDNNFGTVPLPGLGEGQSPQDNPITPPADLKPTPTSQPRVERWDLQRELKHPMEYFDASTDPGVAVVVPKGHDSPVAEVLEATKDSKGYRIKIDFGDEQDGTAPHSEVVHVPYDPDFGPPQLD